jgi:hypothetical protein
MKKTQLIPVIRFGIGLDSYTEEARGSPLVTDNQRGQQVTVTFQMIQFQESILEAINISARATAIYKHNSEEFRQVLCSLDL